MALCDECECYDDNWIDGEDITEEELEKDPLYEPHRYYYWDAPIEEDYDWRDKFPLVDCMCEICFDIANVEKKIKWQCTSS